MDCLYSILRVLQDMEKPYAKLMEAAGHPITSPLQVVAAPPPLSAASVTTVTPVMPVSAEASQLDRIDFLPGCHCFAIRRVGHGNDLWTLITTATALHPFSYPVV